MVPPPVLLAPAPGAAAPRLRHLEICIATACSSRTALLALTSLTSLSLRGLHDNGNEETFPPPLLAANVAALLRALTGLPLLEELKCKLDFPVAAPGQPGQPGQHAQQLEGAAVGPDGAPTPGMGRSQGPFPSLRSLDLDFTNPELVYGLRAAAAEMCSLLGVPQWLASMPRLVHLTTCNASEELAEALSQAVPQVPAAPR
jgi:hypothetical protein